MRDLLILLVHLITTTARLRGPGGARSVIAESLLVKHQLLILNRSRQRAPNLRASDRLLAGVCSLFIRPTRVVRSAIVLKPSTILDFHRHLRTRKYRLLCSPTRRGRPGPKGPSRELVAAIVEMKRRNPRWGCPRLARQIGLAFEVPIDKDVVRRVLATCYRPVRLEFVVRPPLGAEPSPGSGRPNGPCSVRHGPPCGRQRRSTASGPSTTRGCVPRCSKPGSRQVFLQDHGHTRTAYGRDILAASCRSGAPRMSVTEAHEARS